MPKILTMYKLARAVSEKQRQLFGVALAMKRGKIPKTDTPAGEIAENLTEKQIEDYAKKPIEPHKKKKSKKKVNKEAQVGVVNPRINPEGNIEAQLPKAYPGLKSRPDVLNLDRDYLTRLLLREFENNNLTPAPAGSDYANELVNP